jgi:hypothetical protein
MTPERLSVALGALLLLAAALELATLWWALGRLRGRVEGLQRETRSLRQQVANVLTLLLNAGYKLRRRRDWSDDESKTQVRGDGTDTDWDWKRRGE